MERLAEDGVRGLSAQQLDVAGRPGSLLGDRNRLAGVMKGDREVLRDRCDCRVVRKLDRDGDRMNSIIRTRVRLIVGVYDEIHRCRSDCTARGHPGRAESIRFGSAVVSACVLSAASVCVIVFQGTEDLVRWLSTEELDALVGPASLCCDGR